LNQAQLFFLKPTKIFKMKKLFLAAAFVMGLATVSFAGNPKGETKEAKTTTEATTVPSGTETELASLYWFNTNTAGTALTDPTGIPLSQGTSVTGPCNGNQLDYCARGFLPSETTVSGGKRVPTVSVSSGAPDKKQ
jgi:hypothetical protein